MRLEISCPGLASPTLVFQEFEELPCLNLSPDVLLRPAEPCSVWLEQGGMAVKSVSVCRCWAWQFRPNRLWRRLLHTLRFEFSSKVIVNKLLHGPGFYSVPGEFSNARFKIALSSPLLFLMLCSLVGQAKRSNAEPSSMPSCIHVARQTDEIAWEHRGEVESIAEASQFMEVAFYLWCHSSCHLNHLPSIFLCASSPFLLFQLTESFPLPFISQRGMSHLRERENVRSGRREPGLELWGSTGGEQLNIEQLWRSDVMVWQRGGELLESPGWNLECADTGGGKTTEVKRCLVSSNQYRCYGKIDKSCRPIFFWNL